MNSTPVQSIRILLVEDHEVTRIGLRTLLGGFEHIQVVGEAGSVQTALQQLPAVRPDVVLLDVRLPDGSGFDVCRQIHKLDLDTRVLILTSYADDETIFQALAAGADGYLLKEIDSAGLLRALEDVAAGKSILDTAITRRVLSRVRIPAEGAESKSKLDRLSAQERRVLALVAEGKTNKEIAVSLGLSEKTVKNYLSNALGKLEMARRSQAAAYYVQHVTK